MGRTRVQSIARAVWQLVARQHGVVARWQLLELGLSAAAISHRIAIGRLHPLCRGVYAVGRPQLSRHGIWMAAVLACGRAAILSHRSAAALWGILSHRPGAIEISVPAHLRYRRPGIHLHRRSGLAVGGRSAHLGIPVTSPTLTLIDLAMQLTRDPLEAAINQADKLDLIDPETLRADLERFAGVPGVRTLRETLDRRTFTLTDSAVERAFFAMVRRLGIPKPLTQQWVNGYRVDFYWPGLGLVVETDGLRYHRTPAEQSRDLLRDQAHAAGELTPLRFTRAQIHFEPASVEATLSAVIARLERTKGD